MVDSQETSLVGAASLVRTVGIRRARLAHGAGAGQAGTGQAESGAAEHATHAGIGVSKSS